MERRGNPLGRLIERLDDNLKLSFSDRTLLHDIPVSIKSYRSSDDIAQRGEATHLCCFPLDGQLVQSRMNDLYHRQIISFHVPGDSLGLHSIFLGKTEHTITSMGKSVVGFVTHDSIRELLCKSPDLARAIWRETSIETSISHEWAIKLGHREGIARVAHLICEMAVRLRSSREDYGQAFDVPWTQLDVGDACGLSNVHVNRIIQALRVGGVIDWKFRILTVRKWSELVKIAEFSDDYLHLKDEEQGDRRMQRRQMSNSGRSTDAPAAVRLRNLNRSARAI